MLQRWLTDFFNLFLRPDDLEALRPGYRKA